MSIQKYKKKITALSWEEIQYILEISFLSKKSENSIQCANIRKMLLKQAVIEPTTLAAGHPNTAYNTGNDFLIL